MNNSPFAFATSIVAVLGLAQAGNAQWSKLKVGNTWFTGTGNVGIGTTTPAYKLDVVGSGTCVISGRNSIASNGAAAVCGTATSTTAVTIGVYGSCASPIGRGLFGSANNTSGPAIGVYGYCLGDTGRGVFGWADSPTGETYGVYGQASSPQGWAGYFSGRGYFGGNVGFGVASPTYPIDAAGSDVFVIRATNAINSNGAAAVYGHATSTTSVSIGVFGECDSTQGRGVFGRASNATGSSIGVYGYSAAGGSSYGVFAGGNLGATGTKTFRIDHPLDPENAYLIHYSAEGPEPQNIYNGVVTLDASGQGWVQLPRYFQAINKDYRYQLTALDAAMPDLHVARRIVGNSFLVAGGKPGMEVSWEVKAVRNDLWVRQHGAPAEVMKPEGERGTYLRPELYGAPAERGIDYRMAEQSR